MSKTINQFFLPKMKSKCTEAEPGIEKRSTQNLAAVSVTDENENICRENAKCCISDTSKSKTKNETKKQAEAVVTNIVLKSLNSGAKRGEISSSSTKSTESEWYHGSKLSISWLLQTYSFFQKVKLGKRNGIKCTTCYKHIGEAKKFSKNGTVPIADGIRCDDKKQLERIIDHLSTSSHIAARNLDEMHESWLQQSNQHPWIKTLKSHNAEKIRILIEMAIDVYNDSRQLTLSANSWPARSLAKQYTNFQISSYMDNGLSSPFVEFKPSAAELQYKNPVMYHEMLSFVGEIEVSKLVDRLRKADCFSIQVDGSVDKYGVDNKFITARFISEDKKLETVFFGEKKAATRGAKGLLDSVILCFKDLNIENLAKEKLVGLTTDGENANTGKNSGLWVRMKEYLQKDIFCIWCVAHRTDLVLNDLESTISEVKIWKNDLKAVATFYRSSAIRFDELKKIGEEQKISIHHFPAYTEVRFLEHLINLSQVVWKNLPYMQIHWNAFTNNTDATKSEQAIVRGFQRKWAADGRQQQLTAFMIDLLQRLETLQKDGQKSAITIPDIELSKKTAIQRITLMENGPYVGGHEEKLQKSRPTIGNVSDSDDEEDHGVLNSDAKSSPPASRFKGRRIFNTLVPTERLWSAVRNEIILSCKEFLAQRLHEDQTAIINNLNKFLDARTAAQMIEAGRDHVNDLFGENALSSFADEVTSLFAAEKLPPPLIMDNATAKLYHYLKVSVYHSTFSKLVQAYISVTPHSSSTERAVSIHTILKTNKQSCYSRETLNWRMCIALNGTGTALYDPRPAVAKFLQAKDRRRKLPDEETYKDRPDVKKFFSKDSCV